MFYWDIIVESAVMGRKRNITEGWKKSREEEKSPLNINKRQKKKKSARKEEILWQAIDIRVWVEWKKVFKDISSYCSAAEASVKTQKDHRLMLFHCGSPLRFTVNEQCKTAMSASRWTELTTWSVLFQKAFCSFYSVFHCRCSPPSEALNLFFVLFQAIHLFYDAFFHQHPPVLHFSSGRCRAHKTRSKRRGFKGLFVFFFPHPALHSESHWGSKIRVHQFSFPIKPRKPSKSVICIEIYFYFLLSSPFSAPFARIELHNGSHEHFFPA